MQGPRNQAKIPGVSIEYILNGKDHIKAANIRPFLFVYEAEMAKQPGITMNRNNLDAASMVPDSV